MTKHLEDEEADTTDVREPSSVAQDVQELHETILRLARERDRLPQPLFWSLFNSRLKGIKETKELQRILASLQGIAE